MASPATFEVTPSTFGPIVHNRKINIGKLYLRQILAGTGANQSDVIQPNTATGLGQTTANNWGIYDGVGSGANLVAYGQGMHTLAGNWHNWFTMLFEIQRFKGSTLQIMGASVSTASDWAIVGGTGDFAMAYGVIKRTEYSFTGDEKIHEITIDGYCHVELPPVPTPTILGSWGANGVIYKGMKGKSRRLESLTIAHNDVVRKISFSYVGEDGTIRTEGPWGNFGDYSAYTSKQLTTITFGPSEFVKGMTGIATSPGPHMFNLNIVTNVRTYGPFGSLSASGPGTISYNATVPVDKIVVGLFVVKDVHMINRIGFYTIPI